jgi:hypothetical protein
MSRPLYKPLQSRRAKSAKMRTAERSRAVASKAEQVTKDTRQAAADRRFTNLYGAYTENLRPARIFI